MNLSKITDQLYTLRQSRLAAQKEVDAIEKQEKELQSQLFAALHDSPTGVVAGSIAKAEIQVAIVPSMVDPEAFLKWVRKSPKRADCLKIGVVTDAWRTHTSNGEVADGIEAFTKETLSLRKVK